MTREIVIGDVHGCIGELRILIDQLRITGNDHLIFVGDLINKGPDSKGVIDFVLEIQKSVCKVTHIVGNHEEKFLRWLAHEERRINSGTQNPVLDRTGNLAKLASTLNEHQIQFLRSASLWVPLAATVEEEPVIVVHAGIKPGLQSLPDTLASRSSMTAKQWREADSLIRVRRINVNGLPVHLGEEQATDSFWADIYDGRFGTVVFGHEAVMKNDVSRFSHAIGIDLGCVYGGYLAALIFRHPCQGYETMLMDALDAYQPKRSICHARVLTKDGDQSRICAVPCYKPVLPASSYQVNHRELLQGRR